MELAGLEPAASWVRCGDAIVRGEASFRLERAEPALPGSRHAKVQIAADYRGLRSILGTRGGPVPFISLGAHALVRRAARPLLFAKRNSTRECSVAWKEE